MYLVSRGIVIDHDFFNSLWPLYSRASIEIIDYRPQLTKKVYIYIYKYQEWEKWEKYVCRYYLQKGFACRIVDWPRLANEI